MSCFTLVKGTGGVNGRNRNRGCEWEVWVGGVKIEQNEQLHTYETGIINQSTSTKSHTRAKRSHILTPNP